MNSLEENPILLPVDVAQELLCILSDVKKSLFYDNTTANIVSDIYYQLAKVVRYLHVVELS